MLKICLSCKNQTLTLWKSMCKKCYTNDYLKNYRKSGKTKKIEQRYRDNHRSETRKRIESWRLKNLDKKSASESNRRSRKLNATPSWFGEFDEFVVQEAHSLAKLREMITGVKWHVDHVIPLQGKMVCGLHCWNNLQVIPAKQNLRKHNSFERELS